ncbi:hypothetical protein MBLNU230_g1895t1 [Neophaeotheca triangularis]
MQNTEGTNDVDEAPDGYLDTSKAPTPLYRSGLPASVPRGPKEYVTEKDAKKPEKDLGIPSPVRQYLTDGSSYVVNREPTTSKPQASAPHGTITRANKKVSAGTKEGTVMANAELEGKPQTKGMAQDIDSAENEEVVDMFEEVVRRRQGKGQIECALRLSRGPRQYITNGDKGWQPSNTAPKEYIYLPPYKRQPGEPEPATFDIKPANSTHPKKPKPTTSWKLGCEVNIEEYAQRPLRPGTKWSREETEGDRAMIIAELAEEPQTMEMTRAALRLGSARRLEARAREARDEEAEDISDAIPKTRGK